MEVVQIHWQWDNNKTKDLHGITVFGSKMAAITASYVAVIGEWNRMNNHIIMYFKQNKDEFLICLWKIII